MPRRLRLHCLLAAAFSLSALLSQTAAAQELPLLVNGDLSEWEYQTFDDIAETVYAVTEESDARVISAESRAGASGYTLRRSFSLDDTPWLHFRWRVQAVGDNPNERSKKGDDFAWRLYFVGQEGVFYRALNLVYAQHAEPGEGWKSPYAGFFTDVRLHAAAVHDASALGEWQTTTINVGALWREAFDEIGSIGLVGFMTDGDNTGGVMRVQYGEIILSASEER